MMFMFMLPKLIKYFGPIISGQFGQKQPTYYPQQPPPPPSVSVDQLSTDQKLQIGMGMAQYVGSMHQKNQVHRKVQLSSFNISIQPGGNPTVTYNPSAPNYAVQLPPNQSHFDQYYSPMSIPDNYLAPEVPGPTGIVSRPIVDQYGNQIFSKNGERYVQTYPMTEYRYSTSSDVYSLGMFLKKDLKLDKEKESPELSKLIESMLSKDPEKRPNMQQVQEKLSNCLQERQNKQKKIIEEQERPYKASEQLLVGHLNKNETSIDKKRIIGDLANTLNQLRGLPTIYSSTIKKSSEKIIDSMISMNNLAKNNSEKETQKRFNLNLIQTLPTYLRDSICQRMNIKKEQLDDEKGGAELLQGALDNHDAFKKRFSGATAHIEQYTKEKKRLATIKPSWALDVIDRNQQIVMAKNVNMHLDNYKNGNVVLENTAENIIIELEKNQKRHNKAIFSLPSTFNIKTIQKLPHELQNKVFEKLGVKDEKTKKLILKGTNYESRKALANVLNKHIKESKLEVAEKKPTVNVTPQT